MGISSLILAGHSPSFDQVILNLAETTAPVLNGEIVMADGGIELNAQSLWGESNPRPTPYQGVALPTEPQRHVLQEQSATMAGPGPAYQ